MATEGKRWIQDHNTSPRINKHILLSSPLALLFYLSGIIILPKYQTPPPIF
jgi:hypothetical protein